MKRIVRLTESDINRIVKRTIREMDENDYTADDAIAEIDSYIQMVGCSEGRSRLLDDLSRIMDNAQSELSEEEFDKLSDYVYDLEREIYETCSDEDDY
jgi:endonuclease III